MDNKDFSLFKNAFYVANEVSTTTGVLVAMLLIINCFSNRLHHEQEFSTLI